MTLKLVYFGYINFNCYIPAIAIMTVLLSFSLMRGNYNSWLARGWCRCELWCRLLSQKEDTSVVIIASPLEAIYILPLDWPFGL